MCTVRRNLRWVSGPTGVVVSEQCERGLWWWRSVWEGGQSDAWWLSVRVDVCWRRGRLEVWQSSWLFWFPLGQYE